MQVLVAIEHKLTPKKGNYLGDSRCSNFSEAHFLKQTSVPVSLRPGLEAVGFIGTQTGVLRFGLGGSK